MAEPFLPFANQCKTPGVSKISGASKQHAESGKDIRPVLNIKDLSLYPKLHPSIVYTLLDPGHLPAFKVGTDWRFNGEDINRCHRYVEAHLFKSASKVHDLCAGVPRELEES
jgi:hypothetical protein